MPEPTDNFRSDDQLPDGSALVNPHKRFCRPCLDAVRAFRHSKPWRGTPTERMEKFQTLHTALVDAYGLDPAPGLEFLAIGEARPEQIGDGGYDRRGNRVVVAGRLSVTTYLFGFACARGLDREEAFRWSLSLFARMFRRSFAGCRFEGPFLVKDDNQNL